MNTPESAARPMPSAPPAPPASPASPSPASDAPAARRVLVIGTSGAGKSTFAQALAKALDAPHIELDALHWGPNWTPRESFVADARRATTANAWVCDGNYSVARTATWPHATHVVWLNYPRRVVWWRVFWRTLRRGVGQAPLWAGNRESLRQAFFSKDSIVWWSLTTFGKNRRKYAALRHDPQWQHLQWLELRHPRAAQAAIAQLRADALGHAPRGPITGGASSAQPSPNRAD